MMKEENTIKKLVYHWQDSTNPLCILFVIRVLVSYGNFPCLLAASLHVMYATFGWHVELIDHVGESE